DVLGPADTDRLVARRRQRADLLVLVDDADRLDDTPVLPVLQEIADLVGRDGGALVAVTSSVGLPTRFRGLDVELARHRAGVLLRPRPGDGDPLGVRRVRVSHDGAGRGVLVHAGSVTEIQVLLDAVASGTDEAPDRGRTAWGSQLVDGADVAPA
ncbi:MAG: hypothetical protein ACRCSN_14320, partial [Dermatophilaceae bacterium]